jgi:hypothetical protein
MLLLLLRYCVACQLLCCSMICWRLFIIFREYSQQACFAFLFQYFMILPLQNYRMTCFIKPPSILACDMTWLSSRSGWKTRRNLVLFILRILHIASFMFEVSLKDTYHMICLPSLSLEGPIIARLLFCTWRVGMLGSLRLVGFPTDILFYPWRCIQFQTCVIWSSTFAGILYCALFLQGLRKCFLTVPWLCWALVPAVGKTFEASHFH